MNIQKTNKIGLFIIENGFKSKIEIPKKEGPEKDNLLLNGNLLKHNHSTKVYRVSKSIIQACKLIDIKSIKENIDEASFNFRSIYILLDNDKSGVIKIERFGSDFSFVIMSDLCQPEIKVAYNSYSFISKEFSVDNETKISKDFLQEFNMYQFDSSVFVVQIISYLIYGDITEKFIPKKQSFKSGVSKFLNNSKSNIVFCDTLWRQRISTNGFKVKGHFRLQPIGENRNKRKLIWIEEFEKVGYNRKATLELQ